MFCKGLILFIELFSLPAMAIYGGSEVSNEEIITKSVAALVSPSMISTGVIISDRLLLTAAHNTVQADTFIGFGKNPGASTQKRNILKFIRHPSFKNNSDFGASEGIDLALILLDQKIPNGFTKVQLKFSNPAASEKRISIAGFGKTDLQTPAWPSRLKKTDLQIQTTTDPNYLQLSQNRQTGGACSGDSGGPAYTVENENILLWGILHGADASGGELCIGISYYTKLEIAKDWILSTARSLDPSFP